MQKRASKFTQTPLTIFLREVKNGHTDIFVRIIELQLFSILYLICIDKTTELPVTEGRTNPSYRKASFYIITEKASF